MSLGAPPDYDKNSGLLQHEHPHASIDAPRLSTVHYPIRHRRSSSAPLDSIQEGEDLRGRPTMPPKQKSERWRRLTELVRSGHFLLDDGQGQTKDQEHSARFRRRQKAKAAIRQSLRLSLTQCFIAVLSHVVLAVIVFSFVLDEWSIIDSVYFSVVTFSTVGYGDVVAETHAARIFTCFYALSGVTCLGICIGVVGSSLIDRQEQIMEEANEASKVKTMALFSPTVETEPPPSLSFAEDKAKRLNSLWEKFIYLMRPDGMARHCLSAIVMLAIFGGFGLIVSQDPAVKTVDIFYFLTCTATTLGFGDVTPSSQAGRLATAIFIPFAVGSMGHWLAIVAGWFVRARQQAFRRSMEMRGLTLADIEAMDDDGDGDVTMFEFFEFMLIAMGKVEKELWDELKQNFERLDLDSSGTLSKEDLIAAARKRLRDADRKMELAKYKQKLLQQAEAARNKDGFWNSISGMTIYGLFQAPSTDNLSALSSTARMSKAEVV